jgi:hypothetical protein
VSLTFHSVLNKLYTEPSIGASSQMSVHLAIRFQKRRFFKNQPTRNNICLWCPCLLSDRDGLCNLYRRPSIDYSYQVSVDLAQRFQSGHVCYRIWTKLAIFTDDLPWLLPTKCPTRRPTRTHYPDSEPTNALSP